MQRRHLVGTVKLLFIMGGLLLLLPMLMSSGVFNTSPSKSKGMLVKLSQLQPGQYHAIEYAGREIWVYRWSTQDRRQHRVQDERQAWSVLIPYEPHRGCRVHLQEDMRRPARFVEPCFNASFDARGRKLAGTGIAAQRDLPRLPFQWHNDHEIRIQLTARSDT